MPLHLPLLLILGFGIWFLGRKGGVKLSHVLVCAAFGFFFADTSASASVHTVVSSAVSALHMAG